MTLLGYVITLGYVFLLIFALGPVVKKISNLETSRKAIHIALFAVWVLLDVFFRNTVHQIIIPIIFIVLNLLSYRFKIYKSVEREAGNHFGTVYFAVVVTMVMTAVYFFPSSYYCGGAAILCLTFGDGFAALLGHNLKSPKIYRGKSLVGFLSCAVVSTIGLAIYSVIYKVPFSALQILVLGLSAAILELLDYGLDNFSVTLGVYALSCGFLLGGNAAAILCIGMLIGICVFLLVFFAKSIDYSGALLALVIVASFFCFGGTFSVVCLICCYAAIFIVSHIKKHRFGIRKGRQRGFRQILINGGLGTAAVILHGFSGNAGHLIISVVAIGGCFADSLSSDIGVLSKGQPYDFLKRQHVPTGISGGVSPLGTAAALLGAVVIAAASAIFLNCNLKSAVLIAALIFAQSILDTILGSTLQAKYRCPVCGCVTESKTHCQTATHLHSGLAVISNNMVNLISSAVITAAAAAIFWR